MPAVVPAALRRPTARRQAAIDPDLAAAVYRHAWTQSDLRDHALFGEGLALVRPLRPGRARALAEAHRRANPRAALRQAEGGARAEGRWAVAVCKDNGKPPQVTMGFDDFVALLSDWHELRMQRR